MKFLLQNTWLEFGDADDIMNYCNKNNYNIEILNETQLVQKPNFFEYIYFCDTCVVYNQLLKNNLLRLCPDTYDYDFYELFKRNIIKVMLYDVKYVEPFFIKPVKNTKIFSGHIVYDKLQLKSLQSCNNVEVYISNIINIVGEYRLLIGNNKLYGSSFMKGAYDENYLKKINIDKIIELVGIAFMCVDIGILTNGEFIVVEINLPYSLDDYDIEFEKYINFCIDSCTYINSHVVF